MRKYLLLLTILFFAAVKVFPQTTVTIASSSEAPGSIVVPINVENFSDVSSISIKINYDTNALTFDKITDAPVAINASASGGVLSLGWFDATASSPINISSGTLVNLHFNYSGGLTNLSFDVAQSQLSNSLGNPINTTFVNGQILQIGSTIGLTLDKAAKVAVGETASVGLNLVPEAGAASVKVGAISVKVKYDSDVLTFSGLSNKKNEAITANAANGVVTISWFDATASNPITFDASGTLVGTLNFVYNGGYTTLTFDQATTEITNELASPFSVLYTDGAAGSIVSLSFDNKAVYEKNTTVSVPLKVEDFNDVGSFSLKVKYNGAVMQFTGLSGAYQGITISSNPSVGTVTLGWFDQTGNTPLNVGSGTLVNLDFNFIDGNSFLSVDPNGSEVTNSLGQAVNVKYTDGSVYYQAALALTIAQIQTPTDGTGDSPYVGKVVTTTGVVTAIDSIGSGTGFSMQDGSALYSGIWVYDKVLYKTLKAGDKISITTTVDEYNNLTELNYVSNPIGFTKISSGNAIPSPITIKTGEFAEGHEMMLIKVLSADVVKISSSSFDVNDGTGVLNVYSQLYKFTPAEGATYDVTGIGTQYKTTNEILPRYASDVVVSAVDLYKWWEIGAGSVDYFLTNDHAVRGMSYNPVSNNLLVVSRTGTPGIHIINSTTGEKVGTLDMTGVAGGTYPINMIAVADDGVIYAANLTVSTTTNYKIYRWENESAVPTVAYDGVGTARTGDSFAAIGAGTSTVLYASGNNAAAALLQFTTADGLTYAVNKTIPVAGVAGTAIAPVSADLNSNVWINKPGAAATLIATDGTVLTAISGSLLASSFNSISYIKYNNVEYIGVTGGNSATSSGQVQLWDVTDLNSPKKAFQGALSSSWNANANGTGSIDLAISNGVLRVFQVVTNNGIAAYGTEEFKVPAVELTPLWSSLPDYFGANTERGSAFGFVQEQNRFYVVTRNVEPRIAVHDAKTGEFVKFISQPQPPVGYFPLNVARTSADGILFVANGVPFGFATDNFTVYRYDSENSDPEIVISYTTDARIGDMFTLSGRADDNTLTIYAAKGTSKKFVKFTTQDNGHTFAAEEITLSNTDFGTDPIVAAGANGELWVKSYPGALQHYAADGSYLGAVPTTVVGTGSTNIKYFEFGGQKYVAVYYPNVSGTDGFERADIINVSEGVDKATVAYKTASIGNVQNTNGAGALDVFINDNNFVLFVQGSNNGIAAFATTSEFTWPAEFDPTALAMLTHQPGNLEVSVYNDGRIGDVSGMAGAGISWKGQNGVWRAAPVWGRKSAGYVNGTAHNNNSVAISDLVSKYSDFRNGFGSYDIFDSYSEFEISDDNAENPYGLPVTVMTFSRANLEAVILAYKFTNNTAEAINDLYSGLFLDFDVDGNTYTTNSGGYSEGERMVYVYDASSPYYYGATAVYGFDGYNVTKSNAADNTAFRKAGLDFISTHDADGADKNSDMRAWIGSKVPDMAPGQEGIVAFILSAGDQLIDLRTNMDAAVSAAKLSLDEMIIVTDVPETPIPTDFAISQNYPNPFNPSTSIKYELPTSSNVKVKIFNLLGETVEVLVNKDMNAGYHTINWNASNLASGIYFYSIEAKSLESGKNFNVVKKMMLLK